MERNILNKRWYLYLTEFFAGMSVIDGLINKEIGYYQKLFRQKGIKGLLAELQ